MIDPDHLAAWRDLAELQSWSGAEAVSRVVLKLLDEVERLQKALNRVPAWIDTKPKGPIIANLECRHAPGGPPCPECGSRWVQPSAHEPPHTVCTSCGRDFGAGGVTKGSWRAGPGYFCSECVTKGWPAVARELAAKEKP